MVSLVGGFRMSCYRIAKLNTGLPIKTLTCRRTRPYLGERKRFQCLSNVPANPLKMKIIDYENNEIKISDIPHCRKSKWLFSQIGERHEDRTPIFIGTLAECIRESKKHSGYIQENDAFEFKLSCDYDYMSTTHPGLECIELAFDNEFEIFGVIEFINCNDH